MLRHGGALYRDAVDRKPPLVPYLYAAGQWLTGTDAQLFRPLRGLGQFLRVTDASISSD